MLGDEPEKIYLNLYVIRKNYRQTSCSSFPGRRLKNAMLVKYRFLDGWPGLRGVSSFFSILVLFKSSTKQQTLLAS